MIRYQNKKILIVGDGDFSFSASISSYLNSQSRTESIISPVSLLATSYDSLQTVIEKYPNARSNILLLLTHGSQVFLSKGADFIMFMRPILKNIVVNK